MQGDLISRKAVMELIESKCTNGCLGTDDTTLIDAHGLIDDVSDLPTAFNVDAVETEMESFKTTVYSELLDEEVEVINFDRAKAIVRKGGKE